MGACSLPFQRIARLNLSQNIFISGRSSKSSVPMSNFEKDRIRGTRYTPDGVNHPEYKVNIPSTENNSEKRSHTPSYIDYNSIFTITIPEEEKEIEFPLTGIARELFYSPEIEFQRKWFFLKKNQKSQEK